jgi:superfamily II DNA or RNA helicase
MILPILVKRRLVLPIDKDLYEVIKVIKKNFTYKNPEFYKLRNLGLWTGGTPQTIKTWYELEHPKWGNCISVPRGGTIKIRDILQRHNIEPYFIDRRLTLPGINNLHNNVELRLDQTILAQAMIKKQNCLIRSPTGSGKTETALKVIEWILKDAGPVLVIVWETGLLNQWIDRIVQRFNIKKSEVGVIKGGIKKIAPITVGMQQSLVRLALKYSHSFGGVLADEVQKFAARTYQKVIDVFPAKYRIGISADETRKDEKQFLIYDAFGEVAEEIENVKLIDQGSIMDVVQRIVPTGYNYHKYFGHTKVQWQELPVEYKNYNELLTDLCSDKSRNDLIWKFILASLKTKKTLMIVTRRVSHAKYWESRIRNAGYSVGLMIGGVDNDKEFNETMTRLRSRTINAGVGTISKIGQGHDIPQWDRGFVLTPLADNRQQYEQVIGRLRRTCEGKRDSVCYYFWDELLFPWTKGRIKKRYPNTYIWVKKEFLPVS